MDFKKYSSLNEAQKAEIKSLAAECFRENGLQNGAFLSNELNVDRNAPCFYLGYEGEKLVSFLTVFFPTREDGEINAFTHPDFRRQGWFSALYREAAADLCALGIGQTVFALEPQSKSAAEALAHYPKAKWLRSEYRMVCQKTGTPPLREGLHVAPLTAETKAGYLAVSQRAFEDDGESMVDAVLNSQTRKGYLLCKGEQTVGVFDLDTEGGRLFLYGVGVTEELRCQGFGREIVYWALREGEKLQKPVVLDVDSDNPPALHLYRACGFETTFQVDYYAYPLRETAK